MSSDRTADRTAITDCLLRYTRGIDRLDGDLVASAFHPGAILNDYGPAPAPIEAFVDRAMTSLRDRFRATQHRMANVSITFDGEDAALVEAYVEASHVEPGEPERLHLFAGRYIDRFERRDDWRIAERTLRNDWSKVDEITETMAGAYVRGTRNRDDVSYG